MTQNKMFENNKVLLSWRKVLNFGGFFAMWEKSEYLYIIPVHDPEKLWFANNRLFLSTQNVKIMNLNL